MILQNPLFLPSRRLPLKRWLIEYLREGDLQASIRTSTLPVSLDRSSSCLAH
jgi:hypothetical protein